MNEMLCMEPRRVLGCALLLLAVSCSAQGTPKRPHILGIKSVEISVSNTLEANSFYSTVLGSKSLLDATSPGPSAPCVWCEKIPAQRPAIFVLPSGQSIILVTDPTNPTILLRSVTYIVDGVNPLKKYLKAQRVQFKDKALGLSVVDPEGHTLVFVERGTSPQPGMRIIHTGFIVRDQAAMDHFYKDILGFRPYWHGGMKDHETSWISLQVPDGTDWIEYMVNLPPDPDQRLRGIMNHIALGVPDIQAAREQLAKNGAHLTEEPKLGRDGKWQLNLYDPDQTRIEFMEFAPKEKPCCSEFTGPHPKP
jgi:catechol 2,3-dioxygenase-like lactoylglutathione lyase family enzyme